MRLHSWPGIACGFMLFILVFIHEKQNGLPMESLRQADPGLLLFIIPGLVGGLLLRNGCLIKPLLGVLLALPVCFLVAWFWMMPVRSVLQEMAWLFSAIFWCSIGAYISLFINTLRRRLRISRRGHIRL